jgi:hypothetical protein
MQARYFGLKYIGCAFTSPFDGVFVTYSGGSNSAPVIGGPQKVQGGP